MCADRLKNSEARYPKKGRSRFRERAPFSNLGGRLAAAGGAAAVGALVATAVGGHEHAAFGAVRRVFEGGPAARDAIRLRRDSRNWSRGRYRLRRRRSSRSGAIVIEVIRRDEFSAEPAADVIDDRFRVADFGIAGVAGRLEAGVAEFIDERAQRNAVLQCDGGGQGEGVHDAGERGAFLGHLDEDLAGRAVLVFADGEIAFVAADGKFVGDGGALVGKLAAARVASEELLLLRRSTLRSHRFGDRRGNRRGNRSSSLGFLFFAGSRKRLRALGIVAVNSHCF